MSIEQTVSASLTNAGYGQYMSYAQPVITALVDREQQIVARLVEYAQNSDLDTEAVRGALAEAGMHMPVTPPAAAPSEQTAAAVGDLATTLGRIEQALSGLTDFARANGYRG